MQWFPFMFYIYFVHVWYYWQIMASLPELKSCLLVHLWIRSVKELLKIWNIFLILMMRKGNYWCCIVIWRVYHPFVTTMNEFTMSIMFYTYLKLSVPNLLVQVETVNLKSSLIISRNNLRIFQFEYFIPFIVFRYNNLTAVL